MRSARPTPRVARYCRTVCAPLAIAGFFLACRDAGVRGFLAQPPVFLTRLCEGERETELWNAPPPLPLPNIEVTSAAGGAGFKKWRRVRGEFVMNLLSETLAVALLALTPSWLADSAGAAPLGASLSLQESSGSSVETVQWRGHNLASHYDYDPAYYNSGYYYDPGYYYIPGEAPAYNSYGYAPGGYIAAAPARDVDYCAKRYRSYDPASGTYLGYDGRRHPCP
jgi:hypothetical protein